MSDVYVVNVKWQWTSGRDKPEWVELTMSNGYVWRYRPESFGGV